MISLRNFRRSIIGLFIMKNRNIQKWQEDNRAAAFSSATFVLLCMSVLYPSWVAVDLAILESSPWLNLWIKHRVVVAAINAGLFFFLKSGKLSTRYHVGLAALSGYLGTGGLLWTLQSTNLAIYLLALSIIPIGQALFETNDFKTFFLWFFIGQSSVLISLLFSPYSLIEILLLHGGAIYLTLSFIAIFLFSFKHLTFLRTFSLQCRIEEAALRSRAILSNISQGIFTVRRHRSKGFIIEHDFSDYLNEIIGREDIAGHDVFARVFQHSDLSREQIDFIKSVFELCFHEPLFQWELVNHNLPSRMKYGEKFIEIGWDVIVRTHVIASIAISLRDVSRLKKAAEDLLLSQKETQLIATISALSDFSFSSFMILSKKIVDALQIFSTSPAGDQSQIFDFLRNLHMQKGIARQYGFEHLSSVIHDLESIIAKRRQSLSSFLLSRSDYEPYLDEITHIRTIAEQKLRIDYRDQKIQIPLKLVTQWVQQLPPEGESRRVREDLIQAAGTRIDEAILGMQRNLASMALELNKKSPHLLIDTHATDIYLSLQKMGEFEAVIVTLLRNAIDHGIEEPGDRLLYGKDPAGTIRISAWAHDRTLQMEIEDDGRGLHLSKIFEIGRRLGLVSATEKDTARIAELILKAGVTSRDQPSAISGRGIGLDALVSTLENDGGHIRIHLQNPSEKLAQNDFTAFKLAIHWPGILLGSMDRVQNTAS